MAQTKIQAYMDRHKLGPLFEDLMNKVLRDMPEEPLIYLLRTLYKKSGMEIPQEIRYGGLRKSVDLARSRSPERVARPLSSSEPNALTASREYEKPWQSLAKRIKPRHTNGGADAAKSGKSRPDWQSDTKVPISSFDELWEHMHPKDTAFPGKKSKRQQNDKQSSWASVGLENGEMFVSGNYQGPGRKASMSVEDLLAAESIRMSGRDVDGDISQQQQSAPTRVVPSIKGVRSDHERHRQELESMLHDTDRDKSRPPPLAAHCDSDVEEDAIELLENADDLKREGVKNISAAGYKLSKIMRERSNEPCVKLNITLSPRRGSDQPVADSVRSFEGYDSDGENSSPAGREWESEDDNFESVSQISGPRMPVWQVPDSDVENGVKHGRKRKDRKQHQALKDLAATAPESLQHVTLSAGELDLEPNKTGSPGHVETKGRVLQVGVSSEPEPEPDHDNDPTAGWDVPDDSDAASVQDWNQRVKGKQRDPRVY